MRLKNNSGNMWRLWLIVLFAVHSIAHSQPNSNKVVNEQPFILGKTINFYSDALKEQRVLNIYLPEGYNTNDTTRYPVIYLLDGGKDEDFIHIAGLVQFDALPWVKRLPPSIVVGIDNTDRKRDFTYPTTVADDKSRYPTTGGSANFIRFISSELQPFIEKHFKADNNKTIIGQSLGGLLAAEILIKAPDLFNKYVIISPSLWWDDGSLLKTQVKTPSQSLQVYIGVGKEGLGPSKIPHVMEVDANLFAEKLRNLKNTDMKVFLDYLPGEDHGTITHHAVSDAFEWLNKN